MIIKSLLDTDLYKLTMMQLVFHKYANVPVEYEFKLRGDEDLSYVRKNIEKELINLTNLQFTDNEIRYLRSLGHFREDFLKYLETFRLDTYNIILEGTCKPFKITIKGTWLETILFEVPLLSIINELYFKDKPIKRVKTGKKSLISKINMIKQLGELDFKFSDFGTRRRYSREWQRYVVKKLKHELPENFNGTSNVLLAMDLGLTPIGTMAHEYLQAFQGIVHPRNSQKFALSEWITEYGGKLAIALTDVIGMDAFLKDFDLAYAKVYDGLRHDSGKPIPWGEKAINHYKSLGIDPKTKTLVFSDGLDVSNAIQIYKFFKGSINTSFGIGTNLSNDVGLKPLQIVIKMVTCNGLPVAKLSDSPGKTMCKSDAYVAYLKEIFDVK